MSMEQKDKQEEAQRFLSFALGNEGFAIPLLTVKEVIALPEITALPGTPPHFLGIMNLRGQIIPIVDLRLKLKTRKAGGEGSENAVVILDLAQVCVGVVVDSVDSVLTLGKSQVSPSPQVETSLNTDYLQGVARVGEKLVLLLDVQQVLDLEDKKIISQQQQTKPKAA
jgi:purine-binding chemotaxis protein CheW